MKSYRLTQLPTILMVNATETSLFGEEDMDIPIGANFLCH